MERVHLPTIIDANRIFMRRHDPSLAETMFRYVDRDRERLGRFMPWVPFITCVQDEADFIRSTHKQWERFELFDYGIFRKADGTYMGNIGVHNISWHSNRCELGYWILGDFEGQGYISEAVTSITELLFKTGFNRVEIKCDASNERSANVPRGLGFRLEGRLVQDTLKGDRYRDTYLFARVRSPVPDWLTSLGYKTDLFFPAFDGRIINRGDYLVIESPQNPGYYWGNLLIFSQPPKTGDFKEWVDTFSREFSHDPKVRHMTFGWNGQEKGEIGEFIADGFKLEESVVLGATALHAPARLNSQINVRALSSDADWEQAIQNQCEVHGEDFEFATYERFKKQQMRRYRRMQETGLGAWFGAFIGERLVGDLGVFVRDGLARYQSVGVHADYRNQGICGTLVWKASEVALQKFGAEKFFIVADPADTAARVYASVGFEVHEHQYGLCRSPQG